MARERYVGAPVDLEGRQYNQTVETMDYIQLLKNGFSLRWTVFAQIDHTTHCNDGKEGKHPPNCSFFQCGKLGWLKFPFNNETNPECGLRTIVNCTEEAPKIQLERGGRHFEVKNIQGDTIIIQDEQLQEHLKHGRCDFIDNLTSSPSPSVFFTPVPTLTELTLFKCHRSHNIDLITEYNYTRCQDYIIHYNHSNHIPPTPPPPGCSIIQYPVNMSTVGIAKLDSLLTPDITLEVNVFSHCWNCLNRGGQCQDDEKGKFQCAHVKGNDNRLKLALGSGISAGGITILIICFIIRQRHKRKYASTFLSRNTSSDPSSQPGLETTGTYFGIPIFPYSELEEATYHFVPDREIGDGGFGTVYHDLAVNRMTTLVAELAFRCLQPDKEMRPSMDEVLEILKEIESNRHELENMDAAADSVGSSMREPPPPSPDCDEVGLLKSVQLMPSPDSTTAQWASRSTTPSASA
ncbi:hypothetical protein VitviT2T_000315 [Vitis vinifera]|uniref:Uncharacterized protein n=1 Tax=Vitis vinifera TaxID=29760 RepID=A0ABY9BCB9_VITVI|nr:hypothetical protein VitviT2T_000315 [Vitis vinifera]